MTPRKLRRYEPALPVTRREAGHESGGSYLIAAYPISHGRGYIVRTRADNGDVFTIMREADGEIERTGWIHGQHCAF